MKEQRWIILASALVSLLSILCWYGIFTFLNAYIIKDLGRTNADWTATTLWFIGGVLFWQILGTGISSRIGRLNTVLTGLVIGALFYLAVAFTRELSVIRVLLFLTGFIQPAVISWIAYIAEHNTDRPGRAMAIRSFIEVPVGVAILLFGGRLISALDYRTAFFVLGLISALCAIAFYGLTGKLPKEDRSRVGVSLWRISGPEWASLLRGPFLVIMFMGISIEPFNFHTINQLFPNLARDVFHLSEGTITNVVALGRLPALLSLLFAAHLIDRVYELRFYGFGLMLAGVAVSAAGLAGNSAALFAAYICFYIFHGAVWGSNFASVNVAIEPKLRDAAFAIVSIISMAAVFLVGVVHNRLVSNSVPLPHIFVQCGLVAGLAGLILIGYSFSRAAKTS